MTDVLANFDTQNSHSSSKHNYKWRYNIPIYGGEIKTNESMHAIQKSAVKCII